MEASDPLKGYCDSFNVQTAVAYIPDGTVILKAALDNDGHVIPFDFGYGAVVISRSLTVKGEILDENNQVMLDPLVIAETITGDVDPDMTQIVNGSWPFVIADVLGLYDQYGIKLNAEIRNIHFNNPNIGTILVARTNDFAAIGNRITADTMHGRTDFWCLAPGYPIAYPKDACIDIDQDGDGEPDGWGESFAWGIFVVPLDLVTGESPPEYINGKITINDNFISLERGDIPELVFPNGENGKPDLLPHMNTCGGYVATADWRPWFNSDDVWTDFPIFLFSTRADADIKRNVITENTAVGILQLSNDGTTVVEGNVVDMGPSTYHICSVNNGIAIYNRNFDPTYTTDAMGNIHIANNKVIMHDRISSGISIGVQPYASFVSESIVGNRIIMDVDIPPSEDDPDRWSFGIFVFGTDDLYIGQNTIDGTGAFGIGLGTDYLGFFNGWTFGSALVGNNISNLEGVSGVYLAAFSSDTVVVGGAGTLIDLGENNTIKGGYTDLFSDEHITMPGGVGLIISDTPNVIISDEVLEMIEDPAAP